MLWGQQIFIPFGVRKSCRRSWRNLLLCLFIKGQVILKFCTLVLQVMLDFM